MYTYSLLSGAIQLLSQESKADWKFPIFVFLVYIGIPAFYSMIIIFVVRAEWVILGIWTFVVLFSVFFVFMTGRAIDVGRYQQAK